MGGAILAVLVYAYLLGAERSGLNPFNYFGYFTNLTSLLTALVLILPGVLNAAGRPQADVIVTLRAVATTCMVIVGVIYNVLVPGTGTAPVWVSVTLHVVIPVLVVLDWLVGPDRRALPWSRLWWVLPYPLTWLTVVLVRGVTDGWVPYGFLLASRGLGPLVAHIVGLLAALVIVGALVWWTSRLPRFLRDEDARLASA